MAAAAKLALEQAEHEFRIAVEALEALYKRGYEKNDVTDSEIQKARTVRDDKALIHHLAMDAYSAARRKEEEDKRRAEMEANAAAMRAMMEEHAAAEEARRKAEAEAAAVAAGANGM